MPIPLSTYLNDGVTTTARKLAWHLKREASGHPPNHRRVAEIKSNLEFFTRAQKLMPTLAEYEASIKKEATSWTSVIFKDGARRTEVFTDYEEAKASVRNRPRALLYAVTAAGRFALVPQEEWDGR